MITTPRVLPILLLQRLGDENPIRTLRDYSKPFHEGYRNTIELYIGNNVVPSSHEKILLLVSVLSTEKDYKTPAGGDKLRDKNTDESWEIIKNLTLYDHEGWNDTEELVKPVKAISTPQPTSKMPNRRLLELEDQIKFLLK
ncbi:hypothetical protein Tco_1461495, partial [Tanacetum coccineum]